MHLTCMPAVRVQGGTGSGKQLLLLQPVRHLPHHASCRLQAPPSSPSSSSSLLCLPDSQSRTSSARHCCSSATCCWVCCCRL